jgi:hypothetical protein
MKFMDGHTYTQSDNENHSHIILFGEEQSQTHKKNRGEREIQVETTKNEIFLILDKESKESNHEETTEAGNTMKEDPIIPKIAG